jgi:hypothetical protein
VRAGGRLDIDSVKAVHDPVPPAANPFFEEWALDAALEHLAPSSAQIELVRIGEPGGPRAALPLVRSWRVPFGIGPIWSVWDHIHCFDTTPSHHSEPDAVLEAVFEVLSRKRASMLRWTGLPTDTAFYEALMRHLDRTGLEYRRTRTRLRPVLSAGGALGGGELNGKRMSEFRRRRRRLEEAGKLDVQFHDGPHDAGAWMYHFLELEASGWKGANGTAMVCNAHERRFFESLMRAAAVQGKVLVCGLMLDGRPIAMTVNLRTGGGIWGFKTAYDNEFARFSPGALCVSETAAYARREPSVEWVDSCMDHDDGPAGALWEERRQVVDLLIAAKRTANWLPPAAGLALSTWRFARNMLTPVSKVLGKHGQSTVARGLESRIRRIVTGITSIVVLPEMPTVVLFTASI